tara:strand:- start:86 stop:733 length:648 start_codon:yes stop_codon:yes gene_type:complete
MMVVRLMNKLLLTLGTVLLISGCSEPKELEPKELTGQEILNYIDFTGEVTELYLETYLEYVFNNETYIECLSDDDNLHPWFEGKEMLYMRINPESERLKQNIGTIWKAKRDTFTLNKINARYSYDNSFIDDQIELDRELLTATRILTKESSLYKKDISRTEDYTCRILSEIEIRELEMQFIATRKKQQIDKEREEELKAKKEAKEEAEQKAKNKI